jgi:carboxyl-terminal processing protease
MNNKKLTIFLAIAIIAGFAGGFYYRDYKTPLRIDLPVINQTVSKPASVDFAMFWDVWNLIKDKYVDRDTLDTQKMIYGAISGMVNAAGDPYTAFFTPKDTEAFNEDINGSFSGIGIEIGIRNEILTVIAPIAGTPADKAGIMAGDKIAKIGDKSTEGMSSNEAVTLIRGPKGTSVKLSIVRDSLKEPKEYTIFRDTIKTPTVSLKMLDGKIAYVQLYVFNKNVDYDFQKIAKEISRSKADRIILDVRNNPGGLLDSSVNIAGYFLNTDSVVTKERYADGKEDVYRSDSNGLLKNYPLIVILNEGSASASEILTGALKDNRHITIVGQKSFGKGLVQEVDSLSNGASVKITIAKWYTPNGLSIQGNGITPDIVVERTEADINANKDPQLDKAVELIKNIK